jgi:hypothetical protein
MSAYTLQSHEAIERWDEISALLQKIEHVEMPLASVRAMVAAREAQVWCIGTPLECVLLTKIENTPESRYGLLWMASGDLRLIAMGYAFLEPWFRSMGCAHVQIIGRPGWKRLLPDFTVQSINLVKKL